MSNNYMVLPSRDYGNIKLVRIPDDMEQQEAFRYATGLIASFQEESEPGSYEDLDDLLEEKGFTCVDYVLGPELDRLSGD